ncbi:PilZ domain-containing protein [Pseudomonas sp. MMS21-TM103]|uniref:PilZ domain-containing protein n=1 Tax=unclassified Pseudomonas TaxID=196821 RepID=UPI001EE0C6B6|nr:MULTISPECIES: PilZ domain-containing protein [unclassified Pseudomonas]MCG4451725.1 PilZ domain-containing protein [Pseudomonas sp. MMS21 TM103]
MHDQPLLTQEELDFIQHLHNKPGSRTRKPAPNLLVDAGTQLKELLAYCAANEQLTIEAHIANQRLTFTAHLVEDAQQVQHLELGTPQIFEDGPANRAWRLPLDPPVALRQLNAKPSGLWVHELSLNGLLIELRTKRATPEHFKLILPLAGQRPITVEGNLVRKTSDGLLAYQLDPLDKRGSERLQQFIFQQHRALHPEVN